MSGFPNNLLICLVCRCFFSVGQSTVPWQEQEYCGRIHTARKLFRFYFLMVDIPWKCFGCIHTRSFMALFFNGRHTLETAARFLFQVSFYKAVQQLFWHLTHLAFNHGLTAPQCLTDYVVKLSHSRDHWKDQTPEIFHLEGTSGGHINQLSSLSQPNFRTKNPVNTSSFKKAILKKKFFLSVSFTLQMVIPWFSVLR